MPAPTLAADEVSAALALVRQELATLEVLESRRLPEALAGDLERTEHRVEALRAQVRQLEQQVSQVRAEAAALERGEGGARRGDGQALLALGLGVLLWSGKDVAASFGTLPTLLFLVAVVAAAMAGRALRRRVAEARRSKAGLARQPPCT